MGCQRHLIVASPLLFPEDEKEIRQLIAPSVLALPKIAFGAKSAYRIRLAVRDGKGRSWSEETEWNSREVTRD
jgi:hypothetical protein